MRLIIESGATKGDWRLISSEGRETGRFLAEGTNVSTMPMDRIAGIIRDTAKEVAGAASEPVSSVHLYTAGVITTQTESELTGIIRECFQNSEIEIQNDLTAAARAVCGHKPGIAAILGTGSNSCQYDGGKIVRRIYSCGYILGDEGSAATLGRLFIADFLKGLVPERISLDFASRYDCSYATIVENVYRSSGSPSAYLGNFAPFIMEYYDDPYIKELVDGNFRNFFRRSIKQYDYTKYPVGIVGGFGNALKEIIERIASEEGITISGFLPHPIEGLKRYHIGE